MNAHAVLIVVDVQNGFMPGGGLPVPRGDEVVPLINALAHKFTNVVLTQDWHPASHASFASSHADKNPYDVIKLPYGDQVLWPDHCVQGTQDAALHKDLYIPHAQLIIRKGFHAGVDSYSAFQEADRTTSTGLAAYLKARALTEVHVCGLATDFCVAWTALDAHAAGFEVTVHEAACRAIDLNGSLSAAWAQMLAAGVRRV
jgi:nicotinamidase/pyrazinamidase